MLFHEVRCHIERNQRVDTLIAPLRMQLIFYKDNANRTQSSLLEIAEMQLIFYKDNINFPKHKIMCRLFSSSQRLHYLWSELHSCSRSSQRYFLVSRTSTPLSSNSEMRLGNAMSAFMQSARFHTMPKPTTLPTNTVKIYTDR